MIRDIHLILFNVGQSDIDRVGCSIEMEIKFKRGTFQNVYKHICLP